MDGSDDITKRRLEEDEDFINLKRFDFSVSEIIKRYPEGVPDRLIAQGLCISEERLEEQYQVVVRRLRLLMKVDNA